MTTTETRHAIDRCKEILTVQGFAALSDDQKRYLCQLVHTDADATDILLAVQSLEHPLAATIKKHRGTFYKRKFYLDGVLPRDTNNRFETRDEAAQFAQARGIQII